MKVQLVTNPATDADFRAAAERVLRDAPLSPERVQSRLSSSYPQVCVVRGIQDRDTERWYVYRDGHWIDAR